MQINFLNKAINTFSTAIVTPIYYVFFTTASIITSAVLFKGYKVDDPIKIVNIILAFFGIIGGVLLLFEFHLRQDKQPSSKRELSVKSLIKGESMKIADYFPLHDVNESISRRHTMPKVWSQEMIDDDSQAERVDIFAASHRVAQL